MAAIDQLLNKVNKTVKIDGIDANTSTIIKEEKVVDKGSKMEMFDVPLLREQKSSILSQINPKITDQDKKALGELSKLSSDASLKPLIMECLNEFMSEYFKDKTLLTESADPQTIYLKIGNSLFKGSLTLMEQ